MKAKTTIRQTARLSQSQQLALTPAIRTALTMLRMSGAEIEQALLAEAADNPFLRISAPKGMGGDAFELALRTVAEKPSLTARVTVQLATMRLPENVRAAAMFLVSELEPDGMLTTPLADIAAETGASLAVLESGLTALQNCEPAGVGARNLTECLWLQLCDFGYPKEHARQAIDNIDLFARQRWAELSRLTGLPSAGLEQLARDIRRLSPRPAEPDTPSQDVGYLVPDLILDRIDEGGLLVRLSQTGQMRLQLDTALLAATNASVSGEMTELDQKRDRAEAVIRALEFRGATLLRVGQAIAERQRRFFDEGAGALLPLSRADIALMLELHPSTVGRAVAGKAMQVDGVLVPLTTFFSSAIALGSGETASAAVQFFIRRLIDQEAGNAPLSDEALCAALYADGVDIARRTVAKYRKCMRIPSSFERRRRKAARNLPGDKSGSRSGRPGG